MGSIGKIHGVVLNCITKKKKRENRNNELLACIRRKKGTKLKEKDVIDFFRKEWYPPAKYYALEGISHTQSQEDEAATQWMVLREEEKRERKKVFRKMRNDARGEREKKLGKKDEIKKRMSRRRPRSEASTLLTEGYIKGKPHRRRRKQKNRHKREEILSRSGGRKKRKTKKKRKRKTKKKRKRKTRRK